MQIIRRIKLDFARESHMVKIFAKQGDINSRYVEIEPLENGLRYQIPDGVIARFAAKKPDGTEIFNDYPTISENIITVVLTEQTLSAAGDVECDIQLYDEASGQVLKAQTFVIRVRPDVLKNAKSSNEYQSYEAALLRIEKSKVQAVEAVEAAKNALAEAEAALAKVDDAQVAYDQMMDDFVNLGGIAVSEEEPTNPRIHAYINPTRGNPISVVTSEDIAQEMGEEKNKIPSVAATKFVTDHLNQRLSSAEQKIKQGLNEEEITKNAVSATKKWLDEHPEATTTVQDLSLTKEKFSDDLKLQTLNDYVNPQMFGGTYDGTKDNSEFIQSAIEYGAANGKSIVLSKDTTYRIDKTICLSGDVTLVVDGILKVNCDIGIKITGSNNTVKGDGEICCVNDNVAIMICVDGEGNQNKYNTISVRDIKALNRCHGTGIAITGSNVYAGQCFDYINSRFTKLKYGIHSYKSANQHDDSWYTGLRVDSDFICLYSIFLEWACEGSIIKGSIQPFYKGDASIPNDSDITIPVVTLPEHAIFNGVIWDTQLMYNSYAISVRGKYVTIIGAFEEDKINIPPNIIPFTRISYKQNNQAKKPVVPDRNTNANEFIELYSCSNDVLYKCYIKNYTATYSYTTEGHAEQTGEIGKSNLFNVLFDGLPTASTFNKGDEVTLFFDFNNLKSIRFVCLFGDILPDSVTVSAYNDKNELIKAKTVHAGIDYNQSKQGGYNICVVPIWDFIESGSWSTNIKKLVVQLELQNLETYRLSSMSALAVENCFVPSDTDVFFGKRLIFNDDGTVTWETLT